MYLNKFMNEFFLIYFVLFINLFITKKTLNNDNVCDVKKEIHAHFCIFEIKLGALL